MAYKKYSDAPPRSNKKADNWRVLSVVKKITLRIPQDQAIIESIEEAKERGIKPTEWLRFLYAAHPTSFKDNKKRSCDDAVYQFRLTREKNSDIIDSINYARCRKVMPVEWLRELFETQNMRVIIDKNEIKYYCYLFGDNMRQNDVILLDSNTKIIGVIRGKKAINNTDFSNWKRISIKKIDDITLGQIRSMTDMFNLVERSTEEGIV